MNMTFQDLGAGMISLGVAVGVACVFHAGLMILTTAVAVDRDDGDGNDENDKAVKTAEMVREAADGGNGW
jgi:tetrahydrodipicolinate N-succinyltransferase